MSNVSISITDDRLTPALDRLTEALQNATPLMRVFGEIAVTSVKENFEVGGRPPWKPLSPVTLELRRTSRKGTRSGRVATSTKILFVTGALSNIAYKVFPDRVELGTHPAARAYAAIHQYGGLAGRNRKVRIPARPYMVLQDEDLLEMGKETALYLTHAARQSG
jgi:phage virion morphogenesis protein